MQTFISVETVRFHLEDKNKLIVQYVYRGDEPEANKLRIFLDDNELTYEVQEYSGIDVSQRYARYAIGISKEYYALVTLPKNYTDYKKFTLKIDSIWLDLHESRTRYLISNEHMMDNWLTPTYDKYLWKGYDEEFHNDLLKIVGE